MSSKPKPEEPLSPLLGGVNINKLSPSVAQEIKQNLIDESGFLIDTSILQTDDNEKNHQRRQEQILSPNRKPTKPDYPPAPVKALKRITGKSRKIPGSLKKANKPIQDNLVKCPLCEHKAEYAVLFVHIQMRHPEKNPKIVMAEFNKAYKKNKFETKYEEDMNSLVKEYERLKQGQDESRDGGKYMGHMRREQGKFGSLPLYDDYSDDSDSK